MVDSWQIDGVLAAGDAIGIKKKNKPDLAVLVFPQGANWSAVTTRHQLRSHTVRRAEKLLQQDPRVPLKCIVINSGNANACTGPDGAKAIEAVVRATAMQGDFSPEQIVTSSTGVIGVPLPVHIIRANVGKVLEGARPDGWHEAASAICTTDQDVKMADADVVDDKGQVVGRIGGIAKGAGMIGPNMATMLCYLATDLTFSSEQLDRLLKTAADQSFNRIIVDGDQSTNDSVFLAATCKKQTDLADLEARFQTALNQVTQALALMVVRDGEGARRIAEIRVSGALSDVDAEKVAREIGRSPLVKTALYGADPNWGRIAMAAGNAGVAMLEETLEIEVGGVMLFQRGENLMDAPAEARAAEAMQAETVPIHVRIGRGPGEALIWASDLGHEYITVNADYRS